MKNLIRSEEGATMVEYGLMVALIALIALVSVAVLGVEVTKWFSDGSLLSSLT